MTAAPEGPDNSPWPEVVVADLYKGFGRHRVLTGVTWRCRGAPSYPCSAPRAAARRPCCECWPVSSVPTGTVALAEDRRRRPQPRTGRTAPDRLRVPGGEPLPHLTRGRERRLRPPPAPASAPGGRPARRRGLERLGRPLPPPAIGRPAAAGSPGPCPRRKAPGRPARRAVRLPRRSPPGHRGGPMCTQSCVPPGRPRSWSPTTRTRPFRFRPGGRHPQWHHRPARAASGHIRRSRRQRAGLLCRRRQPGRRRLRRHVRRHCPSAGSRSVPNLGEATPGPVTVLVRPEQVQVQAEARSGGTGPAWRRRL